MNLAYEFSKVKGAFGKVREDMNFLSTKISHNYDEFMNSHRQLASQITHLSNQSNQMFAHLQERISHQETGAKPLDQKELHNIKLELKELKSLMQDLQLEHNSTLDTLEAIKSNPSSSKQTTTNSKSLKDLKEKVHANELELFLLKERMVEKDAEILQIKEVNKQMFKLIDELSKAELDLLNLQQ